LLDYFSSK